MGNLLSLLVAQSAFQGAQGVTIIGGIHITGNNNQVICHGHGQTEFHLDLIPPRNFRDIQMDTFKKATENTGHWLLDSDFFQRWTREVRRILWGMGMAGAGKTVLISIVIDYLEKKAKESPDEISVGFAYCRYSQSMSVGDVLMVLIRQQAERHSFVLEIVGPLFARHQREHTTPSEKELLQLLREISKRFKVTFHCLDALDESPTEIRLELVETLAAVDVNLFITSRPLDVLKDSVPGVVFFDIKAADHDVDLFVTDKLKRLPVLRKLLDAHGLTGEVMKEIREKAGGMFLHASLQMDALGKCSSTASLRRAMAETPRTVEGTYIATIKNISTQEEEHAVIAKMMLLWAIYAKRSLTFEELQYVLTFCPDTRQFDAKNISSEEFLLSICGGLIIVDQESRLVRLVHYTAKEPLMSLLANDFQHPHSLMGMACIARLKECGFQNSILRLQRNLESAFKAHPFLSYAYEHLGSHSVEGDSPTIVGEVTQFVLECQYFPHFGSWSKSWGGISELDGLFPLHVAAVYNLTSVISLLLSSGNRDLENTVNLKTASTGTTPLMIAVVLGFIDVVKLLLAVPGIDLNLVDKGCKTALMKASSEGHEGIVRLLLDGPRVDFNLVDNCGNTALMKASRRGHEGIVRLLLDAPRVDVNLVDNFGKTAAMQALRWGREGIVRLLLAFPGIHIHSVDNNCNAMLREASECGHEGIVRLLLKVPRVDVNSLDIYGNTALMKASRRGHEGIVKLLLDVPGVDVSSVDNSGETALMLALTWGYEGIAGFLLAVPGIQIHSVDNYDETTLMKASQMGAEGIVGRLLTIPGVDVNAVNRSGETALMKASRRGHEGVLRLLLDVSGIEANSVNAALVELTSSWTVTANHMNALRLLLADPRVDVNSADSIGETALMKASKREHDDIVRELLAFPGIKADLTNNAGATALDLALIQSGWRRRGKVITMLQNFVVSQKLNLSRYT